MTHAHTRTHTHIHSHIASHTRTDTRSRVSFVWCRFATTTLRRASNARRHWTLSALSSLLVRLLRCPLHASRPTMLCFLSIHPAGPAVTPHHPRLRFHNLSALLSSFVPMPMWPYPCVSVSLCLLSVPDCLLSMSLLSAVCVFVVCVCVFGMRVGNAVCHSIYFPYQSARCVTRPSLLPRSCTTR